MGRSRERKLTEALAAQRLAGRREGRTEARDATYERILKTVVAGIIAKEVADTASLVLSGGPVAALTALESLSVVEWPKGWIGGSWDQSPRGNICRRRNISDDGQKLTLK